MLDGREAGDCLKRARALGLSQRTKTRDSFAPREQARFFFVMLSARSSQRKLGKRFMDLQGIIFGTVAAVALMFLLIGMGRGMIRLPPLYGPPEKNGGTKEERPDDRPPSR